MKEKMRKVWPLVLSLFILYLAFSVLLIISYSKNQNHNVYSLDDAYIHMAIAKNLAQHGVWGVTSFEFASCSSSIIWTLLLSFIYLIFGTNEITPMLLNIIFGSLAIISSYFVLRKFKLRNVYIFIILTALIFITPLPPLMFTGLEHVMHIWVSILFVYYVSLEVVSNQHSGKKVFIVILLSMLLPLIRYEGIVLAAAASLIFLFRGKKTLAVLILVFSLIPIIIFGLVSINKGWSFFPNSLLLKGSFPDVASFGDFISFFGFLFNLFIPPRFYLLMIVGAGILCVVLFLAFRYREIKIFKLETTYMLLLFIVNVILYAVYSKSGWSYRYQSFLIALGIVIISIIFFEYIFVNFNKYLILKISIAVIFLLFPLVFFAGEGYDLIRKTPTSSSNIYEQQYQMGQFLKRYYWDKGVALNDIGASNYFADIKCLDLWGLSNLDISRKRRQNNFTDGDIRETAKKYDVVIAIVYDSWFSEGDSTILPKEWIKAGEWKIQNNVIAGDDVIAFYAVNENEEKTLIQNLKSYSGSLPESVIQSGLYLEQ